MLCYVIIRINDIDDDDDDDDEGMKGVWQQAFSPATVINHNRQNCTLYSKSKISSELPVLQTAR